jgi:MarR-like DNA-binding transcriptional regulator SgrR of sgrS sRNA
MKNQTYFQMRAYFYSREEHQSVTCKLKELENLWYCTQKNVKRKLQQFANEGKINYIPGKGRGNPSKIIFHNSFQQEIETTVLKLIQCDKLEEVISLLQLPIPKTWVTNVSKEIQTLFGIHVSEHTKDLLRTVYTRKLTTLDPLYASINFETFLIHQLGDSLVTYDKQHDSLQPHLAHNWECDNENKIWTFHLRKGVRFHNGHVLTSKDVKYTFERFRAQPSSPHYWLVEDIEKIDCLSPFTICFTLSCSNPFFLRYVSSHNLAILPINEPFHENKWIGTGPFRIKRKTDTLLVLQAFDDYFLTRSLLDEIEIYYVSPDTTNSISYEIDKQETTNRYLHRQDIEIGFRFLAFNFNRDTIVQNASFREAIYHLMDARRLWTELRRSNLQESSSYFFWKSKHQPKNQTWIKSLLTKSGYNGEPLTLYTLEKNDYIEDANWLQKEAAKIGLQLKIKTFTLEEYYTPSLKDADLLFMGEVASTDHHVSFIGAFLNKASIFNRFLSFIQLAHLNTYFEKIKHATSSEKREYWIEEAENYIRKENLFLFLYHPIRNRTFHPMIKDIQLDSFGYVDFSKLWIK